MFRCGRGWSGCGGSLSLGIMSPWNRFDGTGPSRDFETTSIVPVEAERAEENQFQVPLAKLERVVKSASTGHPLTLAWMNNLVPHRHEGFRAINPIPLVFLPSGDPR